MGEISNQQPHEQRASHLFLAMRWCRVNRREMIYIVLPIMMAIFLLVFVVHELTQKQVTVVLNDQAITIETRQTSLQAALLEHDIIVNEFDRISKPLTAKIHDGDVITVDHVTPIYVSADGETNVMHTIGNTVAEALSDLGIDLGADDRVVPNLNTKIAAHSTIEIVRVEISYEEVTEIIPYEEVLKNDAAMLKGKQRIVQQGQDGTKRLTIKKTMENGQLATEEVVDEVVVTEKIDQVVAVGSQNPVVILSASTPDIQTVTKDGLSFGVKKIIEDVTLTAYDAGFNSTGKTEEHPQYGMTYTGTFVEEGRTAAVDPNVIPLGWWFYIEGIGLRKAEDIGSAIKGKKIDVYMDSEDEANSFGRKKGYTVYVVGPNKPAS